MGAINKIENFGLKILKRLPKQFKKIFIKLINKNRRTKAKNLKTPKNIILYITNRCNSRCKHCFYAGQLNKPCEELSLKKLKKIASSLKHPLQTLMITGGEPFLRKDILEICKLFFKLNKTKRITIDTNGMLTEKILEKVERILKTKIKTLHIQLSLEGPEKIHDKMRGVNGAYKKTINTLKELELLINKYKKLQVSILTTICKINYHGLLEFSKKLKKDHPLVLHKFNILRGSNLGTYGLPKEITSDLDTVESQVPIDEMERFFGEISEQTSNKDKIWASAQKLKWEYSLEMLRSKKKILQCMAGYTFGVIYPNGDVSICEPTIPFGNLKEFNYDFYKLWKSKKAEKMRKMTRGCYCIHPCNLLDSMEYDNKTIFKILK